MPAFNLQFNMSSFIAECNSKINPGTKLKYERSKSVMLCRPRLDQQSMALFDLSWFTILWVILKYDSAIRVKY